MCVATASRKLLVLSFGLASWPACGGDAGNSEASETMQLSTSSGTGSEEESASDEDSSSSSGDVESETTSSGDGDGDSDTDTGSIPEWDDPPGPTDGTWVRVRSFCEVPLWIHAAGSTGVLEPDDTMLEYGDSIDFETPEFWEAGRVTAYVDGPKAGEIEKAEMTIQAGVLNYNVTYVDWMGLPLEIEGVGPNCGTTGCSVTASELVEGCPEPFLLDQNRCLSARTYCLVPDNQSSEFCHALDPAIAACDECADATTPEVYACSGPYAEEPRLCAALNRGMTDDPDNADASLFYQSPPYNTYAKWSHTVCPDIYAFSYDDWLAQGGFHSCDGDEIRVTFCPVGF